jgi:hypothetical protein
MKRNEPVSSVYRIVHLWPLAVIVIGIGACAAGAAVSQPYWDFFGLLLILSLASLLGGSLFGFLFGKASMFKYYLVEYVKLHVSRFCCSLTFIVFINLASRVCSCLALMIQRATAFR